MMNKMYFNGTFGEVLRNPQSKTAKAFFDGARAMMTALELTPPSEYQQALSAKNQQHIIALLVKSEECQRERRMNDMEYLLKVYGFDKDKLRGFIFDVPRVDATTGRATDFFGNYTDYIEDEKFQLFPDWSNSYWPNYKIVDYLDDNKSITRNEYFKLSEEERLDYSYIRYFKLETADGKPLLQISSTDRYAMAALIRQDIQIGDEGVIKRYDYALTNIKDPRFHELRKYSGVIMEAFADLRRSTSPILTSLRKSTDMDVTEE